MIDGRKSVGVWLLIVALCALRGHAQSDDPGNLFPDTTDKHGIPRAVTQPVAPAPTPTPPAPSVPPTIAPAVTPPPHPAATAPMPATALAKKKLPLPSAAAIKAALGLVDDAYHSELTAAATSAQKSALATKLLDAAKEEKDPVSQFALWSMARDIAADAGDFVPASAAIDNMDANFIVDRPKLDLDAAVALAKGARTAEQRSALAEGVGREVSGAIRVDDYDTATRLADISLGAARAADDEDLIRAAATRVREVREMEVVYKGMAPALAVLAKTPNDPDANLKVGEYRCFIKGDWAGGLPMLRLGSDATIKGLAADDIAAPATPATQVALGDAWWAAAEKENGVAKASMQRRAITWYSLAAPTLTGLAKARVDTRIKSLAGDAAPSVVNLFKLVDVTKDAVAGRWELQNGQLASDGAQAGRIEIPYTPPAEYDLNATFALTGAQQGIIVVCYAGGHQFFADVGGGSNTSIGIGDINGKKSTENGTTRLSKGWLVVGQKYTCTVKVRKNEVQLYVDGNLMSDWKTDYSDMSMFPDYALPHDNTLGLGGWATPAIFYSFKITEITGKGSLLPGRNNPPTP